jgi:hypothetical protein
MFQQFHPMWRTAAVLALLLLPVGRASCQLADTGFETPNLGAGNFAYSPAGTPWTFASAGISNNSSGFTSGAPNAPEGSQVGLLQGNNSSISQSAYFAAGQAYSFTFDACQRVNDSSAQMLNVSVGSDTILSQYQPGNTYTPVTTGTFTVPTSGVYAVNFQGYDPSGNDYTAFIDNIQTNIALTNASFETPAITGTTVHGAGPSGDYLYGTDVYSGSTTLNQVAGVGWNFTGAGIQANGSAWGAPSAPNGTQAAFIQQTGSVTQSVTLPYQGIYAVTFDAAQRSGNSENLSVTVGGQATSGGASITPASSSSYTQYTVLTPSLNAGTYNLGFNGLNSAGGDNSAFVDAVGVQYVGANVMPEASTWVLLAMGGGLACARELRVRLRSRKR